MTTTMNRAKQPSMKTATRLFLGLCFAGCATGFAGPACAISASLTAPANNAVFQAGATITLTATATPTSGRPIVKVEFFRGTTLIGTDTTSPYSFAWTNVAAASYSLTAKATDSTGATATSSARSIKVNAPPTVSLTAPANNAFFNPGSTVALAATAADSDGTISKVEFLRGTTLIGTDTTSPYSFNWTNAATGAYVLTARATDSNGAVTTSAAVNVTVDTAPTVSITAPANNAVFLPATNVTVTASAADTDGTVAKVDFLDGATLVGSVNTPGPFTTTLSNLAAGTHTLTARATDNLGRSTTSAAVAIRVDAAPTVSITAPANNAVFTPPANITFTATAADTDGTVTKVDFFDGATLVGSVNAPGPFTTTLSNLAVGTHTLTARATDNNSAVTTSAAVSVIVNTAPTVSITAPANNAVFTQGADITFTATAADTDGTVTKVDFFDGATLVGTKNAPPPFSVTFTISATGTHTLTARATDNNGAVTTSAAVSVLVDAAPTISITAPANNAVFTQGALVVVTITAADTDGTVTKVDFFYDGALFGTKTVAPYTFAFNPSVAGTHALTARATDNNGAVTTSAAVSVIVNVVPTVSITAPANNAFFTPSSNITVTATAADTDGSIDHVDFFRGTTLIGTAIAPPYSATWSNVPAGQYSLTAKATDNQGAVTTSAAVFVTVTPAPALNGRHDTANCTAISGWVWDAFQPNTPISVDIYSDGVLLTTVLAGNFRQDLLNIGIGNGNHGFSFTTPAAVINGAPHAITVKFSGTQTFIPNTGQTLNCIAPGVPTPPYGGWLEQTTCTVISGWAWNPQQPNSPINVDFYSDGVFLISVPANQFRQDLVNAGIGNGVHGFSFSTPNSAKNLATQTHSIAGRFPGTTLQLTQSPWSLSCSNALPLATLTSPAQNSQFTAPATITLAASATDADGTVAKVDFFDGAALVGTAAAAPYGITLTNVAAGAHTYTARATDNVDGVGTSAVVNVVVNAAPAVSITAPANNAVFATPANITVTATAADADGAVVKVDFFDGAIPVGTATVAPYSVTLINVAPGTHAFTARATDNKGGTVTSAVVNVIVNVPPTVSITAPAGHALFNAPANLAISATAADTDGTIARVDFYQGATLLGSAPGAPYGFIWAGVAAGSYSLSAVATDDRGTSTTSAVVAITVSGSAGVSLTAPEQGAVFAAGAAITLTASAIAQGSVAKVEFYQGATLIGTATTAPYSVSWSAAASGTYQLTAVATDNAEATTTSSVVTIRINATPTVALTSPTGGANFAAPTNITVAANAADSDGTIAKVEFYRGGTLITTLTTPPYSFTWTGVAQGSYALTAVATDDLGARVSSDAVTIAVSAGDAQVYYIQTDHLNTPRLIADASGTTVWRWDQGEPFGNDVPNNNPAGAGAFDFPLRFPGQYFDRETNLAYNWMRDYDPDIGRYMQSDPVGLEAGINTYGYVLSDPLRNFDPDGRDVQNSRTNRSSSPNEDVMRGLECMSKCLKATIWLSSGHRDLQSNRDAGGEPDSYHLEGLAADVRTPPSKSKLRKAAAECGFFVLPKDYKVHIHIDLRDGRFPKSDPDECVCARIRQGA